MGREAELRQLAAFCTADAGTPYVWWQAGAWAGKTALLSWFALHPPPAVRVVPFFVTARFAAQNDRIAFTDVVLEQLGEILGEDPAAFLTPSTRDAHLLRLLVVQGVRAADQLKWLRWRRGAWRWPVYGPDLGSDGGVGATARDGGRMAAASSVGLALPRSLPAPGMGQWFAIPGWRWPERPIYSGSD